MISHNTVWKFLGDELEKSDFGTISDSLRQTGKQISADPLSCVTLTEIGHRRYYIKKYHRAGKGVRRFLGRSRAQGEWSNLLYFQSLGIPIPRIVAYGREKSGGQTMELLITAEVTNATDLATLAHNEPERFENRRWLLSVMRQVADYTRRLHDQGFVHWDLKWRNILVQANGEPRIYFFDCPLGRHWLGWLKYRGTIKDLGCLDLTARTVMTRTQRLRFYLLYRQQSRLDRAGKRHITQIHAFLISKAKRKAAR